MADRKTPEQRAEEARYSRSPKARQVTRAHVTPGQKQRAKDAKMAAAKKPDTKALHRARKLKAIRRLSRLSPLSGQEDRLKTISDIATGKVDPGTVRRRGSDDLTKRLEAGRNSRSPHSERVRRENGPNRKEKGGRTRNDD